MALMQQSMTEKNRAAHQRNAQLSHGAATPEGKERARAANLRHGYYSQLREQALVALGDDPERLAELIAGARQQFRPANPYQAWMTDRLARLQMRIDRSERMQENKAASHLRQIEAKRRESARDLRARCDNVLDFLDTLRRAVARPDFYTPRGAFARSQEVRAQNPSPGMKQILELMDRLLRPQRFTEPPPEPLPDSLSDVEWQEELRGEEGDESSPPRPQVEIAEGRDRDPLREILWNLAGEERRAVNEVGQAQIAKLEAPLSTYARDFYVAGIGKELDLMRREERACIREFSRLGSDLRRLQRESAAPDQKEAVKEGVQPSPIEGLQNVEGHEETVAENAGASGYVEENAGEQKLAGATKCPPAASSSQPETVAPLAILNAVESLPPGRPDGLPLAGVEDGRKR